MKETSPTDSRLAGLNAQLTKLLTLAESFGLVTRPRDWEQWDDARRRGWTAYEALRLRSLSSEPSVKALFAVAGQTDAVQAPAIGDPRKTRYVRTAELIETTLELAKRLPSGLAGIAGIPRSGMLPASQLAMHLHLPLYSLTDGALVEVGHGWRLSNAKRRSTGPVLVVDDTIHNGGTITNLRTRLLRRGKSWVAAIAGSDRGPAPLLWSVVFAEARGMHLVDLWGKELPTPHCLEWNLFSCPWAQHFATDFDGILCPDFTPEEDDDGPRYAKALRTRQPLHLFRYGRLPLIITARLEKYREPTERWLRRWGVQFDRLVMGPWQTKAERSRVCLGTWKAEQLNARLPGSNPPIGMFIESDPVQATVMSGKAGCPVLCPDLGGIL